MAKQMFIIGSLDIKQHRSGQGSITLGGYFHFTLSLMLRLVRKFVLSMLDCVPFTLFSFTFALERPLEVY
ncbi:hypothetical protein LIPSTDRAFT_107810 [Lipomyces starkeyi NRRL Y-11557]|uniref:Uncharacterized protein n=1 Tax=Lipomyces starkeyi NRRL Y-11557 TaxID=675824 RepID=A0A1E3PWB4_LIPST|nr:hypothetical protein LIPSTDRAFT_107810 [Lipomyces starkeyi NRRL Y-11557]